MNRASPFNDIRKYWWHIAAVLLLVCSQAVTSGHIHADALHSGDCYICESGEQQGKLFVHTPLPTSVYPQQHSYNPIQANFFTPRIRLAASIRAPPALLSV